MIIPFEPPGRARQPGSNVADEKREQLLDTLLSHSEALPDDDFVLRVMQRARLERGRRRSILLAFGLLGAAFGALGAVQLAEPIARAFTDLPQATVMQTALFAAGAVAFYSWFMGDDLGVPG